MFCNETNNEERISAVNKTNNLSSSLFGYNRNQVNELLSSKDKMIAKLESKQLDLEKQLKQVSEQLAHYQKMEESLKSGILDARVTGDKIIEDSKLESDKIMEQTNEQVIQYKEDVAYQSRELLSSGTMLKSELNRMKQQMVMILDSYQDLLDETDFDEIYPEEDVDKLLMQLEEYEDEEISSKNHEESPKRESSMSEEEKLELQQLIQEVINNEETQEQTKESKLVKFAKVHGQN